MSHDARAAVPATPDPRKHETPASPGSPRFRRANRALFARLGLHAGDGAAPPRPAATSAKVIALQTQA